MSLEYPQALRLLLLPKVFIYARTREEDSCRHAFLLRMFAVGWCS